VVASLSGCKFSGERIHAAGGVQRYFFHVADVFGRWLDAGI
jgi:hypothetical protein